ncbi:AAA family ATPase [Prosthecodimorpha staleyi]|uniref:AAA family ATPase n=1 Tax=Prosthecodimorpha staleyi TaxID=2840188 RepID=A0A947D694_9HYPH|nr:AAA family ATPase [Prosthecodimorpha staleyi]
MPTAAASVGVAGAADAAAADDAASAIGRLVASLQGGLIGLDSLVERLIVALIAGGHVLLEGAPGLAKTRAVKQLADGLAVGFARVQCTPDLMPADITGTQVWRPDRGAFEFVAGPVFQSLVLVDEINRAPPKVQSALLEAMAERQVTAGGHTYPLPETFMVVATQNPIEHEGTFPLPEAQIDRFLLHVMLTLPDAGAERAILDLVEREGRAGAEAAPHRLDAATLLAARRAAGAVHLAPALKDYIVRLVMATRDGGAAPELRKAIEHPISPRGTLALAAVARARAFLRGRDHALPEDVAEMAVDALAHRLGLTWRASAEGETARGLIGRLLETVAPL